MAGTLSFMATNCGAEDDVAATAGTLNAPPSAIIASPMTEMAPARIGRRIRPMKALLDYTTVQAGPGTPAEGCCGQRGAGLIARGRPDTE